MVDISTIGGSGKIWDSMMRDWAQASSLHQTARAQRSQKQSPRPACWNTNGLVSASTLEGAYERYEQLEDLEALLGAFVTSVRLDETTRNLRLQDAKCLLADVSKLRRAFDNFRRAAIRRGQDTADIDAKLKGLDALADRLRFDLNILRPQPPRRRR